MKDLGRKKYSTTIPSVYRCSMAMPSNGLQTRAIFDSHKSQNKMLATQHF